MQENIILFLDDLREPPPEQDCHVARSYEDFCSCIRQHQYTEIWFDHDLGGLDSFGVGKTGKDCLVFLLDLILNEGYPEPQRIILHTANPTGRKTMQGLVERYLPQTEVICVRENWKASVLNGYFRDSRTL